MDAILYDSLKNGLSQIPIKGLLRLHQHLTAGRKILLSGAIWRPGYG
jgi:hypothetical protein